MKGQQPKKLKPPDPMRMKAFEFDEMMRHALGAPPLPAERKATKKATKKKIRKSEG